MLCLVGEFPVEKKKVSVIIAAFVTKSDDHKNKKQTNKQTNKQRVIATTTSAAEKSGSLCLCLTIYTFCVFHSESTFGGANKMELKKNSSHRLKSQERIDTKVSYFMTMNTLQQSFNNS